jgi:hypothetical protein
MILFIIVVFSAFNDVCPSRRAARSVGEARLPNRFALGQLVTIRHLARCYALSFASLGSSPRSIHARQISS